MFAWRKCVQSGPLLSVCIDHFPNRLSGCHNPNSKVLPTIRKISIVMTCRVLQVNMILQLFSNARFTLYLLKQFSSRVNILFFFFTFYCSSIFIVHVHLQSLGSFHLIDSHNESLHLHNRRADDEMQVPVHGERWRLWSLPRFTCCWWTC